jgi:hypothetical protein
VQGRHNQFQPLGSIFFTRNGFTRKRGGSNSYGLLAPTAFKAAAGAICRLALPFCLVPEGLDELLPLVLGEAKYRTIGVLGVAHQDLVPGVGHFDTFAATAVARPYPRCHSETPIHLDIPK